MSKKEESLETRLTRRVKALYLNKGHALGYCFPSKPFQELNREWFREVFAVAAHEHELHYHWGKLPIDLTGEQLEERDYYSRSFREVRKRLRAALQRLNKNAWQTPPIRRQEIVRETSFPPPPTTEPPQKWLPGFAPRRPPEKIKKRLTAIRNELASRPIRSF